jgi:hypothetical protein
MVTRMVSTRQLSRLPRVASFPPLTVVTTLASGLPYSWLSKEDTSEDAMARVIEFYIPAWFHKRVKWIPRTERVKVLEFPAAVRKSA